MNLPNRKTQERIEELEIDLGITEHYFNQTKSKEVRQALNNLREILIGALLDIKYKFGGNLDEYPTDN